MSRRASQFHSHREEPAESHPDGRDNRASSRLSEADARDELLQRLTEAVRRRLLAEVPLGAFLSGGVDSSSVVAMMAMESTNPVKTFTIGFEEQVYDERQYARAVVERRRQRKRFRIFYDRNRRGRNMVK